jgi:MtrB/PioB family decaheme-associated outer membrane protein
MLNRNTLKAVLVATTCLAPLAAFAEDGVVSSGGTRYEVGIGVMGVVGKNPEQAGRYTGLNTTGVDLLGEFDVQKRPIWSSDGTWYYDASGDNLVFQTGSGLDNFSSSTSNNVVNNGSVNLSFGKQGTFEGRIYYDAITYTGNVINSLYTVNGGQGTLNSPLMAWGGATDGSNVGAKFKTDYNNIFNPDLNNAMQPFQTGTRRDIFGGNFKYIYGDWTFTGAVRHEHKFGSMEESFGVSAGTSSTGTVPSKDRLWPGMAFALPIDYTTDRYDVALAYATPLNQASLQYTFSRFQDGNNFINLPYPYASTITPFRLSAAYSTPPSNDAHYLTLMAATNMVPKTRINLNLRGGLEIQDDMFPPNTADPNPAGALGLSNLNANLQGTTANSLDDVAKVLQGKISVDTHPIANLEANAYYGFDGRWVSLNQHDVFGNTSGGDSAFTSSNSVIPQEWFKQNVGVQVGYRIMPQYNTKLTAGYRFDAVNRSNAQVGTSTTNTEWIALSSAVGPQVYGRLSYEHGDRSGVLNYLAPWVNMDSDSDQFSGSYYQAPMTSDTVKLMADYQPMENLSTSLFLQFRNENFDYPAVPGVTVGSGITHDYNLTVGPSIDYRPSEDVDLHLYYTFERIFFDNIGNGACAASTTVNCLGSAGFFENKYTSDVHTIGASGDWRVTDQLTLGAEYTFAYGSVMFGEFNGVFVASPTLSYQNVSNYPDINSTMHDLALTATYELMPGIDLLFRGGWSYFHDNNWNDNAAAIQGAGSTAINTMTPGYSSPNYSVGTIMTGMKFKF